MNPSFIKRSKSSSNSNDNSVKQQLDVHKKSSSKQAKPSKNKQRKFQDQPTNVPIPYYTTTQVPILSSRPPASANPNLQRILSIDARLSRLSVMFPNIDSSILHDILITRNGDINLCVTDLLQISTEQDSSQSEDIPDFDEETLPPYLNAISDNLEFPPDYNDLQENESINLYGGTTLHDTDDTTLHDSMPVTTATNKVKSTPHDVNTRKQKIMIKRANTDILSSHRSNTAKQLIDIDPISSDVLPVTKPVIKKIQSQDQIPISDTSYLNQWKKDQTCWLQVNNRNVLIGPLPDDFLRLSNHKVNSQDTSSNLSYSNQLSSATSINKTSRSNSTYKPPSLFPLDTSEPFAFTPVTNSSSNNHNTNEKLSPYLLPKRSENFSEYYQDDEAIDDQIMDDLKLSHFLQNQEFMEQVQQRENLYNNISRAAGIQMDVPAGTVLKPDDASYMANVNSNLKNEFYSEETLSRIDKKTKKKLTKLAKKFNTGAKINSNYISHV